MLEYTLNVSVDHHIRILTGLTAPGSVRSTVVA